MALSVFLGAIISVETRTELQVKNYRTTTVKQCRNELLAACQKPEFTSFVEQFSSDLLTEIQAVLCIPKPATVSKIKEHIWMNYAGARAKQLPLLWNNFLSKIHCEHFNNEPLLMELVNECVFQDLLRTTFEARETSNAQEPEVTLSEDEENIIRYACGYIGMKLRRKFMKVEGEKAARFVECLDRMQADDQTSETPSFFEYTTKWIKQVNRGGLFKVSDDAYHLFREIEIAMQYKLTGHIKATTTMSSAESVKGKNKIIDSVCQDIKVQCAWDIINCTMTDEESNVELLKMIVTTWLDIRGFSYAKRWIEDYKIILSTETKKKKSIRKELKRTK